MLIAFVNYLRLHLINFFFFFFFFFFLLLLLLLLLFLFFFLVRGSRIVDYQRTNKSFLMAPPVERVNCKPKYIPDQHPECETDPAIRRENFIEICPYFTCFVQRQTDRGKT